MLTPKKWFTIFISLVIVCLLVITGTNYFVDPYGYFRAQGGDCYDLNDDYYLREIKAEHILNHPDDYDAYLIAGSKGGAVLTENLSKLDGYSYYNAWVLSGNFQDYYYYSKYIINNAHPKKILLQISTTELKSMDREMYGDIYQIPAQVKETSKFPEIMNFLFKNLSMSIDEIQKDRTNFYPCYKTGERDLTNYYQLRKTHKDTYYNDYIKKEAMEYVSYLEDGVPDKSEVIYSCLDYLKDIKAMCEKNDVEFQVYLAPTFEGEQVRYEGPNFYTFLEQLVSIMGDEGVWCFNELNGYTSNPYNFYNNTHFYYEIGNIMIDTMASGKQKYKDFGTKLTLKNIGPYITKRKQVLADLQEFYKKNKTLPLGTYEDESNLVYKESGV